jgi:hypothetical protein
METSSLVKIITYLFMMKNKMYVKPLILSLLIMVLVFFSYLRWESERNTSSFTCRGKMHTNMSANTCNGKTFFDLFLSMNSDGTGYYIVLGSYTCPNAPPKAVDSTIHFTYKKKGEYYSFALDKRNSDVSTMVKIFKYDEIKVKIKKMDAFEYIVYLPFEQPMMCKKD